MVDVVSFRRALELQCYPLNRPRFILENLAYYLFWPNIHFCANYTIQNLFYTVILLNITAETVTHRVLSKDFQNMHVNAVSS